MKFYLCVQNKLKIMNNFAKWDSEFKKQNLFAFNCNKNGLLWLKVRAISRSKQINNFVSQNNINLSSSKVSEQFVELFCYLESNEDASLQLLDAFLKVHNNNWYVSLGVDETKLKQDLYLVHSYEWGGDQNNSLDKYLVSRYVKIISDFNILQSRQNEIAHNAWNYVQTSWYNNWTSYLIESLFKRHNKVVSAVGEIKSVDFFIGDYPIDLKVTYLPNQYMDEKIKSKLGKKELSWLKEKAKKINISVDSNLAESQQLYELSEKVSDSGHIEILKELSDTRRKIISEVQISKDELMKWLYENQGEMRFGAENRLFMVLVDSTNMSQSWKMKRAFDIISPKVNQYLDDFDSNSLKRIDFTFKGNRYSSLADIIFVVK